MLAVSFFRRIEGGFFEPSFDLANYLRFLSPFFGKILLTSLSLSAGAAAIVVAIAFPFTYIVSRMARRAQTMVLVFVLSVLSLSEVIIGFAWSHSPVAHGGDRKPVHVGWPHGCAPSLHAEPGCAGCGPCLSRIPIRRPDHLSLGVAAGPGTARGGSHVRCVAGRGLPERDAACHAAHNHRCPDPRVRLHPRCIPAASGSRPTPALDPVRPHHRSGHLPIQPPPSRPRWRYSCFWYPSRSSACPLPPRRGQRAAPEMTGWSSRSFVGAVLVFLAAPLVVVAGVSVNRPKQLLFPPEGFSLHWYAELFLRSDWANALSNSVTIAALASLLAVSIALPLAYFIWSRGGVLGARPVRPRHRPLHAAPGRLRPRVHGVLDLGGPVRTCSGNHRLARHLSDRASPRHHLSRSRSRRPPVDRGPRGQWGRTSEPCS